MKPIKSATVSVRVVPDIKQQVSELFDERYGLSLSDAVNIFFRESINAGGFPFELKGQANGSAKSASK